MKSAKINGAKTREGGADLSHLTVDTRAGSNLSQSFQNTTLKSQSKKTTKTVEDKPQTTLQRLEEEKAQDEALLMAQILAYYRSRAEAFDSDRSQLYSKLDAIRIKAEVVHKAEWELKKRLEEKAELQKAVDSCKQVLDEVSGHAQHLKRESDVLRVK